MSATFGPGTAKTLIPHRYPILLVDRVLEVTAGHGISTVKAVTCNEPWYQDVPEDAEDGAYAYPTALLIESWCQSAALLAAHGDQGGAGEGEVVLFGGMSKVTVHGQAYPGDLVRHDVKLVQQTAGATFFEGTASVGGEPILTVGQAVTLVKPAAALQATGAS
ncbi:beta-hydroxyacyl-ACP dehydratase [Streptomyces actinomycinicus]|uniref:Beta-hydroxyacyl-ACP dehydratase n=1 Tax=Streptomyces actinomycinicus TaxID=1695166 RepID=A0A937JLB3_9ACTN|nr:3-hydroxyacyl-ACP dehydratase FabZ family protein [Streptomyces actinomycinicus]MBL1081161.1 beta-hydroxyacyl-ACP dehydratase [Streptomyces actinomycinicus]